MCEGSFRDRNSPLEHNVKEWIFIFTAFYWYVATEKNQPTAFISKTIFLSKHWSLIRIKVKNKNKNKTQWRAKSYLTLSPEGRCPCKILVTIAASFTPTTLDKLPVKGCDFFVCVCVSVCLSDSPIMFEDTFPEWHYKTMWTCIHFSANSLTWKRSFTSYWMTKEII